MVRLVLSGNETDRVNECYGDVSSAILWVIANPMAFIDLPASRM